MACEGNERAFCRESTSLAMSGAAAHKSSLASCQEQEADSPVRGNVRPNFCQEQKLEQSVKKSPGKVIDQAGHFYSLSTSFARCIHITVNLIEFKMCMPESLLNAV